MANRVPLVLGADPLQQLQSSDVLADINGVGYVRGPASATDNTLARFNGTSGLLIQGSGVICTDTTNYLSVGTSPLNPPTAAITARSTLDPDSSFYGFRISNDGGQPRFRLHKARGTPGSEADVQATDALGSFVFAAYRNGAFQGADSPASCLIMGRVTSAPSGNSVPEIGRAHV